MSDQANNDLALTAIKERDDELRQIVIKAEALGKLRDALRGISGRVELAESRAKLTGLFGSAKKGARPRPNVKVEFIEMEDEVDPKSREEMERILAQALYDVSKPSS